MAKNGEKIAAIAKHFCGTYSRFAKEMGVTPQVVNHWITRGAANLEIIYQIGEKFPTFNPAFFFDDAAPIEKQPQTSIGPITGNGSGVNVSNNDTDVISRFLSIIEEKDRQIAQLIQMMQTLQK